MAKCDFKLPDEFLEKVSRLGSDFDRVAEDMLKAGGRVVLEATQATLSASVGKDTKEPSRSTGELEKSLGLSPVKMDKDGNFNIKLGFSEPRSDGESNAKIANILEYGKHGQPPKPFLKPAKSKSKTACLKAMEDTFEKEVGSI